VHERGVPTGNHPDFDVSARQYVIEPLVAGTTEEAFDRVVDLVPFLLEKLLARFLSGVDIELVEVGVADDPDLADRFDLLVD
jgi:hypothetical protein